MKQDSLLSGVVQIKISKNQSGSPNSSKIIRTLNETVLEIRRLNAEEIDLDQNLSKEHQTNIFCS